MRKNTLRTVTAVAGSTLLLGLAACSTDDASDAVSDATDSVSSAASEVSDAAGDAKDEAEDAAGDAKDKAEDAMDDAKEADQFRRDAIGQQARTRLDAGRTVLSDCAVAEDEMVPVPHGHLDAWITTLSGLRAAWNVELTGSSKRMAAPTRYNVRTNPTAAAVTDWLGWVLEDVLQTHMFLP